MAELFLHGYRPHRLGQTKGMMQYFPSENFENVNFCIKPGAVRERRLLPNY